MASTGHIRVGRYFSEDRASANGLFMDELNVVQTKVLQPGINVIIFEIFSPKIFLLENKINY
jgi:uncharacterized protein (DUF486 family)